jgi:hypothetical protein
MSAVYPSGRPPATSRTGGAVACEAGEVHASGSPLDLDSAEGTGYRGAMPGYVGFAMTFSFGVDLLDIRVRRAREAPLGLRRRFEEGGESGAP